MSPPSPPGLTPLGLPKFFTDLPKIFPRPTKNVIFSQHFINFYTFAYPTQMFQQHLAIFHKSRPLPVWFLHPWLSATNGFYRNYQELGGGQNGGGGQKIILGTFPPPPPCPPGAATGVQPLYPRLFRLDIYIGDIAKFTCRHDFYCDINKSNR